MKRVSLVKWSVDWAIATLRRNRKNRVINWSHVATLLKAFLAGQWVSDASSFIIDRDSDLADGQHRLIAYVLAYGTRAQVEELLGLLSSQPQTGWKLKTKIDPTQPLSEYVPIRGYTLSDPIKLAALAEVVVLTGADPAAADKCDTDQRKRTGADQLARHSDSANLLAKLGIDGREMQTVLRHMYLRTLPPTTAAATAGAKYGSIRKGGNIHPDRYPKFSEVFGGYIDSASNALYGKDSPAFAKYVEPNMNCPQCPWDHWQLLAIFALAIQGGVAVKTLAELLPKLLLPAESTPGTDLIGTLCTRKYGMIDQNAMPYVLSWIVNTYVATGKIPTIKGATQLEREKDLFTRLGEKAMEQTDSNRLPGWDSAPTDILANASLKNKRKTKKTAA